MNRTDRDLVSASELAQLGYCERVAHFDWRYGARRSHEQLRAQDRGNAAHDQFYKDSLAIARESERKGRCFVVRLPPKFGVHSSARRMSGEEQRNERSTQPWEVHAGVQA